MPSEDRPGYDIFENDYTVLKSCRHGFFVFNRNDSFIGRSLDIYGEWCEVELVTLFQIVNAGDLVVDVGANIGTHTVALGKKVTETGLVLAFEPQRQVFNYLTANVALNNLLHVATYQKAVGSAEGVVRVPLLDPRTKFNFGAVNVEGGAAGEPVEVVKLDGLNIDRCRLIKVDVEGMERKVLEGARETIRKARPVLFVEISADNVREVTEILRDYRYEAWWHIASYYNRDNFFGNADNVFADVRPESNLLCFPREASVKIDGMEKVAGANDTWPQALERIRSRAG